MYCADKPEDGIMRVMRVDIGDPAQIGKDSDEVIGNDSDILTRKDSGRFRGEEEGEC